MNSRVRTHHVAALFAIAVAALGFATASTQLPRPGILFVGVGAAIGILAHRIVKYDISSTVEPFAILAEIGLISYLLRISGYLHLAASGGDTQMWASSIRTIVETGVVSGGGMYGASPLYFLEIAVTYIVLGPIPRSTGVLGDHHVSVAVASFLPVLMTAITARFADRQAGLLVGLLAAVFPLYLRTATLYEAEHLTLAWFTLLVLLFQILTTRRDKYVHALFGLVLAFAAWLHFFYAAVLVGLFAGTALVRLGIEALPFFPERHPHIPFLGILFGGSFLIFHILSSGWSGHAVGVLLSLFKISLPTSLWGLFVPSSDTVGSSIGGGDAGGPLAAVVKYLPIALPIALGSAGGFSVLAQPKQYGMDGIALAVVTVTGTVVLLVTQLGYNLHFRMFYFAGTFTLVFAGTALARGAQIDMGQPGVVAIVISYLVLFIALTGPISPIGNNVDPRFGGSEWVTRSTTWEQKEDLGTFVVGNESLRERTDDFIEGPTPGTYAPQPSAIVVDATRCRDNPQVWDSGDIRGCIGQ